MVDPRDNDLEARKAQKRVERSELQAQARKAVGRLQEIDRLVANCRFDLRHGFLSPSAFAHRVRKLNVESRKLRRQLGIR